MEEKNRKKQKLTEALEDLRMGFIEKAVQPDLQASYGAKVPKNHPVLRWVLVAAAVLLLVGVMFTASIMGNIAWKRSHPAGTAEDPSGTVTASPEGPTVEPEAVEAELRFTSNGDGTCYVSGILNPSEAKTLRVTVPPTHNGETVTAYQPENLIFPIFYFCEKEEFEHWLDVFAEGINQVSRENHMRELDWRDYSEIEKRNLALEDSGNSLWLYFMQFFAYYKLIDNIYVLDEQATQTELIKVTEWYQEYLPSLGVQDVLKQEKLCGYPHGENCVAITQIVSVNLPETVTNIAAFGWLPAMESVVLPKNLDIIAVNLFKGCTGLTSVTIPASVTSIGERAFDGCSSLTTVNYQGTKNQWNAIYKGRSWNDSTGNYTVVCTDGTLEKEFQIWQGDKSNGFKYQATEYGKSWILSEFESKDISDTIVIPAKYDGLPVTEIGNNAFSACGNIHSITIPDGVTSIGERAFAGCFRLIDISVPNSIKTIGDWAFFGCKDLTDITLPDTVTRIGENVFQDCASLTDITIPDSVTSIGRTAFASCESLTSISIPSGVTYIGEYSFAECNRLTAITYRGTVNQWKSIAKEANWNQYTCNYTVICTDGTLTKEQS